MNNTTSVILAAGKSTRFISKKSKLVHELAGLPVISHVYNKIFSNSLINFALVGKFLMFFFISFWIDL